MIYQNSKLKTRAAVRQKPVIGGLVFGIVLFFLFLLPKDARGQTFSLSIWPPLAEIMLQPGKSVTQVYKLSNWGDNQIVSAKILPFEPADEEGNINLLALPNLLSPLTFTLNEAEISFTKLFLIKGGETKNILLKISAPKKVPEKDYFASLVFENNPEEKGRTQGTQIIAKIAANLLITVSTTGLPIKIGHITEFSTSKIIDSFDPVHFTLSVENTGQSFFKPSGKIITKGVLGQGGETIMVPKNVLPNHSRDLKASPWDGNFILGPFKARAEIRLDEEGEKLTAETSFLAFPYKAVSAFILITILLLVINNLSKKVHPKI